MTATMTARWWSSPITSGRGKFFGKQPRKEEKLVKYGKLTLGQVEALVNKLGGMEGVRKFLSGEPMVEQVKPEFRIWKTIKLGTGLKDCDDFLDAIKSAGWEFPKVGTIRMLRDSAFKTATKECEVDLVLVTVAELGFEFDSSTRRDEIFKRASKLGLKLCPPEVGPQLRLQYKEQLDEEWINIGMEPIDSPNPSLFVVGRHGPDFFLAHSEVYSDSELSHNSYLVFVRPRK